MNMVEQVAQAIHAEAYKTRDSDRMPDWVAVARAALGAMRVPTKAMLDAGPGDPYMDNDVWAKMIDAALVGQQRGD